VLVMMGLEDNMLVYINIRCLLTHTLSISASSLINSCSFILFFSTTVHDYVYELLQVVLCG
jgi:hypothetical protein